MSCNPSSLLSLCAGFSCISMRCGSGLSHFPQIPRSVFGWCGRVAQWLYLDHWVLWQLDVCVSLPQILIPRLWMLPRQLRCFLKFSGDCKQLIQGENGVQLRSWVLTKWSLRQVDIRPTGSLFGASVFPVVSICTILV